MTKFRKSDSQPVDDLQRLQDLILGAEKDRLHKLDLRVSDIESRTSDVAEVLPAAMNRLVGDPASKPEFEKPVVDSIRGAIKRDTESFAEALFPVLGPAIRRAIADALKGLVQRINAALEHSFSIKGLKWRLEGARTGVPFAQIVLLHTMLYTVQETFLIQRDSGLILSSVHRDDLLALDEDAVAAMLTAIQSFIQDSFGIEGDEPLRSAEIGERTVWVINGPAAALACVISGSPPHSVRTDLKVLLETLHARYGNRLSENPETLTGDEGLKALMHEALREEVDASTKGTNSFKYKTLWITGGLLLLFYLVYTSISAWRDQQLARQVEGLFHAEPGYVITAAEMDDGILNISGLRDPEAAQPTALLDSQQIDAGKINADFSPYQSLDREVVIRRLQRRFGLDPLTTVSLDGDELTVSGTLSSRQFDGLQSLPDSHALIHRLNLEDARLNAEEATRVFRQALNAPDSVSFQPADTQIVVSGLADGAWYTAAREIAIEVPGWQLDFQPLQQNLSAQLDDVIQSLSGRVFQYIANTRLTPESASSLDIAGAELVTVQDLASALGASLKVTLEGSTDGSGSREKNIEVSLNRSRHLLAELVARGANEQGFTQTMAAWEESGVNPGRRRVTLLIERSANP